MPQGKINVWLVLAAFLGFLSVALGALGAHTLENALDAYGASLWDKAVRYQMFHTMALLAVGLSGGGAGTRSAAISGALFLTGILLFSGSLYLLAVTGIKWLGTVTPFGGVAFLAGWICFGWTALKTRRSITDG